jgi:hypothetical protein
VCTHHKLALQVSSKNWWEKDGVSLFWQTKDREQFIFHECWQKWDLPEWWNEAVIRALLLHLQILGSSFALMLLKHCSFMVFYCSPIFTYGTFYYRQVSVHYVFLIALPYAASSWLTFIQIHKYTHAQVQFSFNLTSSHKTFQIYTCNRNWEFFIDVIISPYHYMFRPLRAILRWIQYVIFKSKYRRESPHYYNESVVHKFCLLIM